MAHPKHNVTSFKPGRSGNPSGRAKAITNLEDLARVHTPAAVAALVAALKSPRERVPAAIALLDRAWGKPRQPISADRDMPLLIDFRWAGDATPIATIEAKAEKPKAIEAEWSEEKP